MINTRGLGSDGDADITVTRIKFTGADVSSGYGVLQIDTNDADTPDAPFGIEVVKVTAPGDGDSFTIGDSKPLVLAWDTNRTSRRVRKAIVRFSADGGATWKRPARLTGNPGHFIWDTGGDSVSTECVLKVILKDRDGKTVGLATSE